VIAGESGEASRMLATCGTYLPAGSSRPSAPSSRSSSTAAAVKLLVIDAIRNTVPGPGAGPPSHCSPRPPACTSKPPATTP